MCLRGGGERAGERERVRAERGRVREGKSERQGKSEREPLCKGVKQVSESQ